MTPTLGLLGLSVVLVLMVVWLLIRQSMGGQATLLQQQMVELRSRLESLTATQAEIPRALAESRAEQATDLSEQLAAFTRIVTHQLDAGQDSVSERLADTGDLMSEVRTRLGQLSESTRRMEEIGSGVARVHEMLKVPQLRGTVGETWLEELLKQMIPSELYQRQYPFLSGERVDCVVRLGDRLLPIDAKFPLEACQRMLSVNGDPEERARHQRSFVKTVRARIDEIAGKYVKPEEGTFDFALMYVPAERVYHEAVTADSGKLISYALNRRVVLASPNTLYAYLATMLQGLRAFHVQRHARAIADMLSGLELLVDQIARTHETMGKHVENAVKQHAEVGRLVQRVRTQLAGATSNEIPAENPFNQLNV